MVMTMTASTIPDYQVVPSTVSASHQDVVVVSYDSLLHWISNSMVEIPVITVTIVTTSGTYPPLLYHLLLILMIPPVDLPYLR